MSRGDKIFVGTVKRLDKGDIIVESGRVEGRLLRSEMIAKENLRNGDRVRAMIMEVDLTLRGAPIILSRSAPEFMIELFRQEVPEIEQGLLEIKSCAREPGARAQLLISSRPCSISGTSWRNSSIMNSGAERDRMMGAPRSVRSTSMIMARTRSPLRRFSLAIISLRSRRPSTRPASTMMSPLSRRLTVPTKILSPRDMIYVGTVK